MLWVPLQYATRLGIWIRISPVRTVMLATDRMIGLAHTPTLKLRSRKAPLGDGVGVESGQVRLRARSPHCLLWSSSHSNTWKRSKRLPVVHGCVLALPKGTCVLFRIKALQPSSSRFRRHQPSEVRSERGLGDDSSGHLRSLLQVAVGAPQGSLPSALHAREFSKAEGAHLFRSHTPISKIFVRCALSVCLLIYVIHSCTDILGTL